MLLSVEGGLAAPSAPVPLFEGLGGFSRKVTTASPEAQRYFDQGLALLYAFNHEEAIHAFRHAGEIDPSCAMAFWGVAVANGPHINNPVVPEDRAKAAWESLKRAQATAAGAGPVERALIEALASPYALPQPEDRKAPRAGLRRRHGQGLEGFPEGRRRRRALRRVARRLAAVGPLDTEREAAARDGGVRRHARFRAGFRPEGRPRPRGSSGGWRGGAPLPERAGAAAAILRDLQPGLGHMVHMPSHVDVRRGRWTEAIHANANAMEADRRYTARSPEQVEERFDTVWKQADLRIKSACLCLPGV